jgi:hypothetical protein
MARLIFKHSLYAEWSRPAHHTNAQILKGLVHHSQIWGGGRWEAPYYIPFSKTTKRHDATLPQMLLQRSHHQHTSRSGSWRSRMGYRLAFWLCVLLVGCFQLALITLIDHSSSSENDDHRRDGEGKLMFLLSVPPPRAFKRELKLIRIDADGEGEKHHDDDGSGSDGTPTDRRISSFTDADNVLLKTPDEPIREADIRPAKAKRKDKVPKQKNKKKNNKVKVKGDAKSNASKETRTTKEKESASGTASENVATQLQAIKKAGKLYSIGRKDRSGSVITDQMFAHAFAFAHGVEYAGACFVHKGLPKSETRTLLSRLGWDTYLKFGCPRGASIVNDPDAEQSQLVLKDDVYRNNLDQSYFTEAWREEIQRVLRHHQSDTGNRAAREEVEAHNARPFEIAVHVRRGDVTPCRYKRRYLPNSHYLALIDQYQLKDNDKRPVHVTIYSESDSFEPFDDFRERGYDVQLDTDLADVWQALASADVTILSRSFFSFVPAAVNPNTVVFTSFFGFDPLESWYQADDALVAQTDRQIRHLYETQCNATSVELERQLQNQKHDGVAESR